MKGNQCLFSELSARDETLTGADEVIVSGAAGSNQKWRAVLEPILAESKTGVGWRREKEASAWQAITMLNMTGLDVPLRRKRKRGECAHAYNLWNVSEKWPLCVRSLAFSSGVHWTNVYLHMPSSVCVCVFARPTVCVLSRQHWRHGLHIDEVLLDQSRGDWVAAASPLSPGLL